MTERVEPAIGQVWEDKYGGSYSGRRVRIDRRFDQREVPPDAMEWCCKVVAYPAHPSKVGTVTYLSGKTLRTAWRHILEGGGS